MRNDKDSRLVPLVIFPAILPSILLPALRAAGVPDFVLGATMGASIGLAIVALAWLVRRRRRPGHLQCSKRR